MKNQKILILTGALLLAGLVACKPNNSSSEVPPSSSEPTSQAPSSVVEEKEMTVEEAEAIIAKFDTSLTGTVKATYHPDYQMNVDSDNASMKAFQEDIDKVITIEADFTAGDLYLHTVVGTGESAKSLSLVYEGSDGYYYVESTMADPLKLANEEAALAKINELITKATKTKAGWVNPETFLYTGGLAYEHKQFLLDSTNVELEFMDETRSFEVNEKGGLDIALPLEYVGYTTDSGISELSPKEGSTDKAGARISISTDEKGRVVSFAENYEEAELEMPLTTPPPVISLHGSHTFAAEYGATLTKKDTIPHEATFGAITYSALDANGRGYFEVFTCKPGDFRNMVAYKSASEAAVGDWLCVKPVAAGSNQVQYVTYANSSETLTDPATANGYYCFEIKSGDNNLGVTFSGNDANPTSVKITTTKATEVSTVNYYTFSMGATVVLEEVAADADIPVGKWVAVKVTVSGAEKVLDSVTYNGSKAVYINKDGVDYYCYEVKLPKAIALNITVKDAPTNTLSYTANANTTATQIKTCPAGQFGAMVDVADGGELTVGNWICVKPTAAEGYEIVGVTHNGSYKYLGNNAPQGTGGYYCFAAVEGENKIVVHTKTAGATTLLSYDGVDNASVAIKTCAPGGFFSMVDVIDGGELTVGNWLCVKPVAADGYKIVSVTHNGSSETLTDPNGANGYYCFSVASGDNSVVVTVEEEKPSLVFAGVENATVEIVTCPAGQFSSLSAVQNGSELTVGNWICVRVTPAAGYTVSSVTHNGSSNILGGNIQNTGGYYCFNVANGTNTIVVSVAAA